MPNAQWFDATTDAGAAQFTDQPSNLAAPTSDTDGVVVAGRPFATIRAWNSSDPLVGTFDVEVWRQFRRGERWFYDDNVGLVPVDAVSPTDAITIEIETRGAIRLFVRAYNFAGGALATCRVSAGTR
jgi:hypothetical protein